MRENDEEAGTVSKVLSEGNKTTATTSHLSSEGKQETVMAHTTT